MGLLKHLEIGIYRPMCRVCKMISVILINNKIIIKENSTMRCSALPIADYVMWLKRCYCKFTELMVYTVKGFYDVCN